MLGRAIFNVELGAVDDRIRTRVAEHVHARIEAIAVTRAIEANVQKTYAQKGVVSGRALTRHLSASIDAAGIAPLFLMSDATHDASAMGRIFAPLRCCSSAVGTALVTI